MNAKRPVFTDKRVRQALCYAVDVDSIVRPAQRNRHARAGPDPRLSLRLRGADAICLRPEEGAAIARGRGRQAGTEIDLIWQPTGGPQVKEITDAIISYWSAVGLKVKNDQQESGVWLDNLIKLNWDADLQTNGVLTGDADFTLRRLYVTTANRNGYANPDLDKLLNDAAGSTDQKQRATLYSQASRSSGTTRSASSRSICWRTTCTARRSLASSPHRAASRRSPM